MDTAGIAHSLNHLDQLQLRTLATAVWFAVLGVASAIIWYRRLRRIRARNRSSMPGVANTHLLSPGGEESEAWVSTRKTIGRFRNRLQLVLRAILHLVRAAFFSAVALIFLVFGCLRGGTLSDRAAAAAGAILFGTIAWWFGNRARRAIRSRC